MAVQRFYYSDTITDFLSRNDNEIVGKLTLASQHDINDETSQSWVAEIETLREVLTPYKGRGSLYFEYNIPRMGRRADVIVVIDGIVFVLEYKTSEQRFSRDAIVQVWDYALDLKNFQEGSLDRILIPIVVAPKERDSHCTLSLKYFDDDVYEPLLVNRKRFKEVFDLVLETVCYKSKPKLSDDAWAKSGYSPTPTIIEAAIALYEENSVEDITKHGGDIDKASDELRNIINFCRERNRKAICFVTGVPGAGKTLIGLNTAIDQFNRGEKAVYLSGNFPLVEVLQEALTRDYVRRDKIRAKMEKRKACTKPEAKSKVKAFIQMIHHYRDLYLEGTEVKGGRIVPIKGYFQSHTDKAYVPVEHVAIFDEAQRAWTKHGLADFMFKKKNMPTI
jgi:broad-specificity NMP kinase